MTEIFNNIICSKVEEAFSNHVIMTDDGHGWFTQGKRSYTNPVFYENEFNSILEAKLMMLLDKCGIQHHQISPGVLDTSLNNREQYEHALVINIKTQNKTPLGVSIHCDAYEDPNKPGEQNNAHGFCVYYYQHGGNISSTGKALARFVADAIIKSDQENGHIIAPRHNHGISGANFMMLRETDAPWILIENGFMTNNSDLEWLRSDKFRNDRALAILDGLHNYIKI